MSSHDEAVPPRGTGGTACAQPVERQPETDAGPDSVSNWRVEVFFDGDCPLCQREIRLLRRLDRKKRIRFTDIAAADFEAGNYGKTIEAFMSEIHGRLPDGTWIRGVEVFRRLYNSVGLRPVVWATRLPVIAPLLDWGYGVFARNRLRWTGRGFDCKTNCDSGTCGTGVTNTEFKRDAS